eukprot:scaffold2917_cov191-Amphora_coffeaeformis.AAC.39
MVRGSNPSFLSRQKILDIIRGTHVVREADPESLPTRIFPLHRQHVASLQPFYNKYDKPLSPGDFHSILCQRIEKASKRIYLASLYVGPAVVRHPQEARLLQALHKATQQNENLSVKILLDKSRGLRPVPIKDVDSSEDTTTTITSAEACRRALAKKGTAANGPEHSSRHSVYLHSVLPSYLQKILPNPLDEAAGVFHIKAYIIDDELILSGANLSEEYFNDRHDRYLHIIKGGNGLVDWYADLVDILCEHSHKYQGVDNDLDDGAKPRQNLIGSVKKLLHSPKGAVGRTDNHNYTDEPIVAIACPTFQAPKHYGVDYRSDTDVLVDLLEESQKGDNEKQVTLRLSSAYLNPTDTLQSAWKSIDHLHCLTAGYVSHGFRPKKKAGNKGKKWIPTFARHVSQQGINVWYYARDGWTYHAKGLWMSALAKVNDSAPKETNKGDPHFINEEDLLCVTHGSGNFGERSQRLDMESNLFLVLPQDSPLIKQHKEEWDSLCDYAVRADETDAQSLQWYIRFILPMIKRYF